jgi:hypothetical protein
MSNCWIKKAVIYDHHGCYHTLKLIKYKASPQWIKQALTQGKFYYFQKLNILKACVWIGKAVNHECFLPFIIEIVKEHI